MMQIINRLKSNKGETIAETLIAFLLLSILIGVVLSCIGAARQVTSKAIRNADAFQAGSTNSIALENNPVLDADLLNQPVITFSSGGIDVAAHRIAFLETDGCGLCDDCIAGDPCTDPVLLYAFIPDTR